MMKNKSIKRICVYCGSVNGKNPIYSDIANRLGCAIGKAGLNLVYGGGINGLMGIVSKATMDNGGHVIGIMPTELLSGIEDVFHNISKFYEVSSFHERKMLMFKHADVFIALPGGPGTLEELSEQLAWAALGHHNKPIFIINIKGYWDPLLTLLDQMNQYSAYPLKYLAVSSPEAAIKMLLNLPSST
ncbi:TIGR00730 family Rossman fold protein [Mucilaginibacter sp. AW1-3]